MKGETTNNAQYERKAMNYTAKLELLQCFDFSLSLVVITLCFTLFGMIK